ncbi:MAG: hypothetical protein ACR2MA_07210 [Egibacteraceae bacterium]
MDADTQVDTVMRLAKRARPELVRAREQRRYERRSLALQPGLEGTLALYGELDAEAGAAVLEALDAPPPGDQAGEDADPTDPDGKAATKARRQADRLVQRCLHRCANRDGDTADGGGSNAQDGQEDGDGHTAHDGEEDSHGAGWDDGGGVGVTRPSMLVLTELAALADDLTSSSGRLAQLLWRSARGPVTLTDQAARRLFCDATVRQVFTVNGRGDRRRPRTPADPAGAAGDADRPRHPLPLRRLPGRAGVV